MVDKIDKSIAQLSAKEQRLLKNVLEQVRQGNLSHLDVKKLKGYTDVYRVRKGNMRIIFQKKEKSVSILSVERRSDTTY